MATPNPVAPSSSRFYFQPAFPGRGDCFLVLAGGRWTNFLTRRIGITTAPFFERPSLAHEPEAFPNGHPYAYTYKTLDDLLKDEVRWMPALQYQAFEDAARQAYADTLALESRSAADPTKSAPQATTPAQALATSPPSGV